MKPEYFINNQKQMNPATDDCVCAILKNGRCHFSMNMLPLLRKQGLDETILRNVQTSKVLAL